LGIIVAHDKHLEKTALHIHRTTTLHYQPRPPTIPAPNKHQTDSHTLLFYFYIQENKTRSSSVLARNQRERCRPGILGSSARDGAGLRRGARRPSPGPGPRAAAAEAGADDRPSGRPRIQCGPRLAARLPTPPPRPHHFRSFCVSPLGVPAYLGRVLRGPSWRVREVTTALSGPRHDTPPSPKASPVESESHSRRKSHGTASVRAATARRGRRRSPEEATPRARDFA
jgi:hypothetical protein